MAASGRDKKGKFVKGHNPSFDGWKGKTFSAGHRKRLSDSHKGLPSGNKGKKASIETREKQRQAHLGKFTGSNNPNWRGGISNSPYSFDFDDELKELVRQRDKYLCQFCGKSQEENDKKLSVHHIDYDKQNSNPKNLITLCSSCNSEVNFDREVWKRVFKLKLKVRKVV